MLKHHLVMKLPQVSHSLELYLKHSATIDRYSRELEELRILCRSLAGDSFQLSGVHGGSYFREPVFVNGEIWFMVDEPSSDNIKQEPAEPSSQQRGSGPSSPVGSATHKGGDKSYKQLGSELRRLQSEIDKLKYAEHQRRQAYRDIQQAEETRRKAEVIIHGFHS